MTDQEITIAIAKECGWVCDDDGYWRCVDITAKTRLKLPSGVPPNYCHDLNAMHEAEQMLTDGMDKWRYTERLWEVIQPNQFAGYERFDHVCATARQRAEAFLRVKGKWKE